MNAKQKAAAIREFKKKLRADGWLLDKKSQRWYSPCKQYRVELAAIVWRHQRKHDTTKKWINITCEPLSKLEGREAPVMKVSEKAPRKIKREVNTTVGERKRTDEPLKIQVSLSPESLHRIDNMAFKQVQTNSRMDLMEKQMTKLFTTVMSMNGMVEEQLRRIKSHGPVTEHPAFWTKMFNKISIRLRKKSVDVQVEDIESGSKRRRVFRCSDWTRVEHFITYRTLTDGIEELEPRTLKSRVPKKTVGKKPVNKPTAKKRGKQPMSKEDVRHVMEKEGIPNAVIPTPAKKMYDKDSAKEQAAINRSRTKAEKVIIKICSPGGPFADAKNGGLIKALEENGFDSNVAFYAAMNCGRITDPSIIKRHEAKNKKTTEAHSNQY